MKRLREALVRLHPIVLTEALDDAFRELGLPAARVARMACPIGGHVLRDKRPAVIAALAAAEVLIALARADDRADTHSKAAGRAATERAA